jgi:hypothetical protein
LAFRLVDVLNCLQEKAYDEVGKILGDDPQDWSIEKLNAMNYLEMCIKETLRLYPSVTMLGRIVTEDVQLSMIFTRKITVSFDTKRILFNLFSADDRCISHPRRAYSAGDSHGNI